MQYESEQHAADLKREPSATGNGASAGAPPEYAVATQSGVRKAEGEKSRIGTESRAAELRLQMQHCRTAGFGAQSRRLFCSSVSV